MGLLLLMPNAFSAEGYATRYWDGCKPHCSWVTNTDGIPVKTCNLNNQDNGTDYDIPSACEGGDAFTCWDMAPKEISPTLSYGYAAVPATGDICGTCYELTFTGEGHYDATDDGSMALKAANKKIIVMATNIGHDVQGGQFDLLIPGGGVGAFNACSRQWNVSNTELGAQYGGFLTQCRETLGWNAAHDDVKSCVRNRCDAVFDEPGMSDLKNGCYWFVDWYEAADNPNLQYTEVACPQQLVDGALPGGTDGGDNGGETGTCTTVTLPGQIEAERFCHTNGMQTQDTGDIGGGQHLSWIETNDTVTYDVAVPLAGKYKVEYRVSSPSGGAISLKLDNGIALGSLAIPSTGSYEVWETASHEITLNAGEQTLLIQATTGGWNLNWINLTKIDDGTGGGDPGDGNTDVSATYVISNSWNGGFVAEVTINNNSSNELKNWAASWNFNAAETITNMWNASFEQNGNAVTTNGPVWNQNIPANGNVTFGFQGSGDAGTPPSVSITSN